MNQQEVDCAQKRNRWVATGIMGLLLCFVALVACSQAAPALAMALTGNDPALTAYTSARFPGGPDSLRATLGRLTQAVKPTQSGQVFMFLMFDKRLRTRKPHFLTPPAGTPAAALVQSPEVVALGRKLNQLLPSWEPGPGEAGRITKQATAAIIPLSFGAASVAPLLYSDDNPTFPLQTITDAQGQPMPAPNLMYFLQSQIRYPQAALLNREHGRVYAYFEVSETGEIEHTHVVGSAGPTLDAEVQRVMQLIPRALTPARQQGRPVRIFCIQPFTFKIS